MRLPRHPRSEGPSIAGYYGTVAALHALGWGLFIHYCRTPGCGSYSALGALAYGFGLRHAFDADHISAIDDTTRLLVQARRPASGVGFFFSLGHSSLVVLVTLLVVLASGQARQHLAWLRAVGTPVGTVLSAAFLLLVAGLNASALLGVLRSKHRGLGPAELSQQMAAQSPLSRLRLRGLATSGWRMVAVGLVFGLSFDTASEVALLGLTAIAETQAGIPPLALLALPILFAAGMTLLDTSDGVFMARAYSAAVDRPSTTLRYSIATTAISVLASVLVAGLQLAGAAIDRFELRGWAPSLIALANGRLEVLGAIIVAAFVLLWLALWAAENLKLVRAPVTGFR